MLFFKMEDEKKFLLNVVMTLTLSGALSTRNNKYPIYKSGVKHRERSLIKDKLRKYLEDIYKKYEKNSVSEPELFTLIEQLSKNLTDENKEVLHNDCFRIGISQKIINLFFKYLWTLGWISEPPHCPFDAVIKNKLSNAGLMNWTMLNDLGEYKKYVALASEAADKEGLTIAKWELKYWNSTE